MRGASRPEVFAGAAPRLIFGDPPQWVALLIEAFVWMPKAIFGGKDFARSVIGVRASNIRQY